MKRKFQQINTKFSNLIKREKEEYLRNYQFRRLEVSLTFQ